MNAPDRFELVILPEGTKKVVVQKDTKVPNAATVIIEREDHTLGNITRVQLLRDPNILFSGYRMPHPLEHKIHIKLQTTDRSNPVDAVSTAFDCLKKEVMRIETLFQAELDKRQPSHTTWM
eukprot:TRINITY_DN4610_c0_g1::TRINITY_DN4610_c0_g1_i1::g.19560::m.19560 TRINITY_DN4610_c0_g1::TRINITY_DN4610_c0_g1_i1::g.19560  ORF type:complete len:121 (-),score=17.31,sp/Q86JJ5/RPB11_DICDI/49.56/2e-40,RNA_pol_L_2/PF13656.1/9.4e-22,RNA_pol_L/PF01193.19/1e-07 TRINITY_DN4610_c0_g1_i1:55-417(-)